MIKLGPMKIGIRKPRSYQTHIEWGDTFVGYWPDLEQWETVQRVKRTNAIHDRITRLLFSETRSLGPSEAFEMRLLAAASTQ